MVLALVVILLIVMAFVGRWIYLRGMRIRNRLLMVRIFTNISHELLTPLTVIAASVEQLRRREPSFAKDYALMGLNIERMVRLLQQILETSKSQTGELRLRVSQTDAMQFVAKTALSLEPFIVQRGLELSIQCSPSSMMGWIDTDKLDKIIYNLISNAAKYTNSPGRIDLHVTTNKLYDHIIIRVHDTGIGIPPDKMKHLFQRFHDGDYRSMRTLGTGLGLALTRDLVYLHGGTIACESQPQQGTTFTVTLPISKESFSPQQIDDSRSVDLTQPDATILDLRSLLPAIVDEPTAQPAPLEPADADSYRILLVEDNVELLMLMRTLLSSKYFILTARNGLEALEALDHSEVDLVITDVMMPQMDGHRLTQHIKSDPALSHLPVILLTARTSDEDRRQSMLIGADDFIAKPFRLHDLELRIDNMVANRKRILREHHELVSDQPVELPPTPDQEFLQRANDVVLDHLADPDFDRDAFAVAMGASSSTLYNRLRTITGQSVTAFIRDIRMREARRIAELQPQTRVSDLAYRVGFKDPKYFAACFKREYGQLPSEFMESRK